MNCVTPIISSLDVGENTTGSLEWVGKALQSAYVLVTQLLMSLNVCTSLFVTADLLCNRQPGEMIGMITSSLMRQSAGPDTSRYLVRIGRHAPRE